MPCHNAFTIGIPANSPGSPKAWFNPENRLSQLLLLFINPSGGKEFYSAQEKQRPGHRTTFPIAIIVKVDILRPPMRISEIAPSDLPEYLKRWAPKVKRHGTKGNYYWQVGDTEHAECYGKAIDAHRARMEWMAEAAALIPGGPEWILKCQPPIPKGVLAILRQMARGGKRRKGWKWSEEARARLSESRKAKPSPAKGKGAAPRAYFDCRGKFQIPENLAAVPAVTISGADLLRLMLPDYM